MPDYSDTDEESEELANDLARLELENDILSLEMLNLVKPMLTDLVKEAKLQQLARAKIKSYSKISGSETRIYAILNNISIRKATAITKKFNLYIWFLKKHNKPVETLNNLLAGVPLN